MCMSFATRNQLLFYILTDLSAYWSCTLLHFIIYFKLVEIEINIIGSNHLLCSTVHFVGFRDRGVKTLYIFVIRDLKDKAKCLAVSICMLLQH